MLNFKKIETFAFITLSCGILYILIFNIYNYNIKFSYDADAHIEYVNYISTYLPKSLRLPLREDTYLFYNPPLGYIVPAISQVACRNLIDSPNFLLDCQPIFGMTTQIFQSFIYVATIFINLRILKRISKSSSLINYGYLVLISLLAVNYRTISMIRSEIYLLFLMSLLLNLVLKSIDLNYNVSFFDKIYLGILVGLLALTRQTAFLLFPSFLIMYLYIKPDQKKDFLKFMSFGGFIGFLLSSWFYFRLFFNYGSFTTFNQVPKSFQLNNLPINFYIPTFDQFITLFNTPARPHLDGQFFMILYSDIWGDYWQYFRILQFEENSFDKVNTLSLISTLIIFYLFIYKFDYKKYLPYYKYLKYTILISFIGFLYFLISFPTLSGDGVKATYMIHIIHLIVLISAINLENLRKNFNNRYNLIISLLSVAFIVNFRSFLTML